MTREDIFEKKRRYFEERLEAYGPTPKGVDWNSADAQETRFRQILKVCGDFRGFTINHYGCGYGALYDFMKAQGYDFHFFGYDISVKMIEAAKRLHGNDSGCLFVADKSELPVSDYTVASGIFNLRFGLSDAEMEEYLFDTIDEINNLSCKGFSFNVLTKYSDAGHIRPDLFYADPCKVFDYCMVNYSRSVALLHDYKLYDFTIMVKKHSK
jgi:hypothetical protein